MLFAGLILGIGLLSLGGVASSFIPGLGGGGGGGANFNPTQPGAAMQSMQNSPIMQNQGLYGNYGQGAPNLGMGGWGQQPNYGGRASSGNAAFPMMYGEV